MPKLMTDLRIREISGVDRAANLAEGWLMMKSATPTQAALLAQASALSKSSDPATAPHGGPNMFDREEFAKANPEAAAYMEGLEAALVSKEAPAHVPTEDEILAKSLESLPEPVRKAVADSQRRAANAEELVRKAQETKEREGFTALAKSMDSLPEVTDASGDVFYKATHGDAAAVGELIELLRKANAVVKSSAAFSEIGSSAPSADSAEGRLNAFAKSVKEANPTMSEADAMLKAAEANPELYVQYRNEVNQRNRGL